MKLLKDAYKLVCVQYFKGLLNPKKHFTLQEYLLRNPTSWYKSGYSYHEGDINTSNFLDSNTEAYKQYKFAVGKNIICDRFEDEYIGLLTIDKQYTVIGISLNIDDPTSHVCVHVISDKNTEIKVPYYLFYHEKNEFAKG